MRRNGSHRTSRDEKAATSTRKVTAVEQVWARLSLSGPTSTLRIERPGTLTWRCTPFLLRDLRKHNALPSTGMPTFPGVSGRCCGIVAERCGDSLATISESTTLTGDINDHNSRLREFKGPRHGVGSCHRQGDHHHSRPRGLEPLRLRTMGLHRESEDCRE